MITLENILNSNLLIGFELILIMITLFIFVFQLYNIIITNKMMVLLSILILLLASLSITSIVQREWIKNYIKQESLITYGETRN